MEDHSTAWTFVAGADAQSNIPDRTHRREAELQAAGLLPRSSNRQNTLAARSTSQAIRPPATGQRACVAESGHRREAELQAAGLLPRSSNRQNTLAARSTSQAIRPPATGQRACVAESGHRRRERLRFLPGVRPDLI